MLALVTGGGRGIGAAIASRLSRDGWRIAIGDLTLELAREGIAGLEGSGHSGWQVDISDEASVQKLFADVESAHGPITALVCNAGTLLMKNGERPRLIEIELDDWEKTHSVNARGTFLCCREFARRRTENPVQNGRIVTTSSVAAELGGYRSSASYISSKSAVLGFTKAVAREVAELGITANCVAPGVIDAPMLHQTKAASHGSDAMQKLAAAVPLGRLGLPEDIADAVAFLVSPQASYITGATLDVNGGYRMA